MTTVATILTAVGYRLGGGITISTTSNPTTATCIQWMNETAQWITGICAEQDSTIGRTIGTITTLEPAITAATKASPCQITASTHGLVNGDEVVIKSVGGMTELNDTEYTVTRVDADNVTLGVDSSSYTTYTSGGYMYKRKYSTIASTLYAPAQVGWLVKTNYRSEIYLRPESALVEYDPTMADEPDAFYVDGSNYVCFFVYPDDAYTVKIPYWTLPTALTTTTDTVPFLGLMDNVFIEAVVLAAQNRDEYDLSFSLNWQKFLLERVSKVIALRRGITSSVGL